MKKISIIIVPLILAGLFSQACKKENKVNKELVGTWTISEYKRAGKDPVTDFSSATQTIEFIRYKKAYTQTMKAVYKMDYTDPAKTDLIDTFRYELKGTELNVSKLQKIGSVTIPYSGLLKRRFNLFDWKKSDELMMIRADSADLYIKLKRN